MEPERCWPLPGEEQRPIRLAPLAALLRHEPPRGKLQHVRVAARAVIGGHEVVADHE